MKPSPEEFIKTLEDENFDLWYLCGIKDIQLNAFRERLDELILENSATRNNTLIELYDWIQKTYWIHDEPEYTHEEWIKEIKDHITCMIDNKNKEKTL